MKQNEGHGLTRAEVQRMQAEAALKSNFESRLNTLVQLYGLDSPPSVICMAVVLLAQATILRYGELYWREWDRFLRRALRPDIGLCAACDQPHRVNPLCDTCSTALDKMVAMGLGEK